MRLFLGVPLAEPVVAELTRLTARLRPAAANLRWSAPESWHITLQFLGDTSGDQYGCLIARLAELRFPPVSIQLAGLGIFNRAGIFYAGVDLTPPLAILQQRIVAAIMPCGFEPESRPYHPHITLARSKGRNPARELRNLQSLIRTGPSFTRFAAREFLLYESRPTPSGSTYEIRHRFPLTFAS